MNATVVKVLRPEFSAYFKCWIVRFRARCPRCKQVCKHGEGFDKYPEKCELKGHRACDYCRQEYRFWWNQERDNIYEWNDTPELNKDAKLQKILEERKERKETRVSGSDCFQTL